MFTNNFIDLGILSMSAISYVVYNIDDFQLMSQFDHCPLQLVYLTAEHRPAINLQHRTLQITFANHCTIIQSQYLLYIHCPNLFLHLC